jgi:lysophospholipase L1-like esterase
VIAPFSTNTDGSDLRTAWITDPTLQIAANTLAGLSIGWTATTGQVIQNGGAKMWYSTGTGKNADAATAAPTLSTAQTTAFNIAIEYEFAGVNQVGLIIGDSLSDGYFTSATLLALDTYHQQYSQRAGIPIIATADYGSNSNEWTTYTQERWQRLIASGHTIDFAVVEIGSNDANNGATLAAFQGYVASIVANIKSLGINRIYFNTVAPRALTGTNETNRVAYNTWLASRPFGIRGVFDVDALLSDPATPANLRSGYAGGDTVHWSPYAHFRASLAWAPIG